MLPALRFPVLAVPRLFRSSQLVWPSQLFWPSHLFWPTRLPSRRWLTRLLAPLLVLPLLLGGCGGVGQPPRAVLLEALSLQIQLTQGAIAQALRLESGGLPEVSRVRVEEQEPLRIGEARGLRLAGHFDWRLAGDPIRVDSPFELYLQRGERGQSWRLARPIAATGRSTGSEASGPESAGLGSAPGSGIAGGGVAGAGVSGGGIAGSGVPGSEVPGLDGAEAGDVQQWLTYPLALRG